MSKLDEIEAYFVKEMPATWPEGYHEACTWLVQRVRQLETALTHAHNRLQQVFLRTGSTPEYASAATEKYREALKES